MTDPFRHDPPDPDPGWIERPRLAERLARRFDLRVLLVVAPAGFGKTAALAQALAAARDDGSTTDVWVRCEPADGHPAHLVTAILRSAGFADRAADTPTAADVADALLQRAPRPVCLVLDDVHRIPDGSGGAALLGDLVEMLPRNAHLVLSGRTQPPIRVARLRLDGEIETLTASELRYDDDELDRVGRPAASDDESGDAERWPALVALRRRRVASHDDDPTIDYLLEEVATSLGDDELTMVTALSLLDHVDDGVVVAAGGGPDTVGMLNRLPLVHRSDDGAVVLHQLWRDALAPPGTGLGQPVRTALARIAEHSLASGNPVLAAERFVAAGDVDGLRRAASDLLARPLTGLAAPDLARVRGLCGESLPGDVVTTLLDATLAATGDEWASVAGFERVARTAHQRGDDVIEALALQNAMNMRSIVDPTDFPAWMLERADALGGAGDDLARLTAACIRSHRARFGGDPEASMAALRALDGNRSPLTTMMRSFALGDLGRPEEVRAPDEQAEATQSGGQYLAQALWMRGALTAEDALALGRQLATAADASRFAHVRVPTNSVMALVAVSAGDVSAATEFAGRARLAADQTASSYVRAFAGLATAAVELLDSDDAASAVLDAVLADEPIVGWPARPYLYALPLVYVLEPASRSTLDACVLGPALTVAQRAGQALVALREESDARPAAELPWGRPDLLRAHVLPPHLAELAAAAAASGAPDVEPVLERIPSLREHLVRAADVRHRPTATWTRDRVVRLPPRPDHDLGVDLLGPTTLRRGTTVVTEAAWTRRERVRELMALVALHRRLSRRRAAELLWRDLPIDNGLANLRVNLTHLQKVLQPDRDESPPWFVRTTPDSIELAAAGVHVDVDRFEQCATEARRLDESGRPAAAIELYRDAAEQYRGDLLDDLPGAAWVEPDRARLRALATGSLRRLGELLLARGEPEDAARWTAQALGLEALHERAVRLLASALEAQGDRAGGARVLGIALEHLADEGLTPERLTRDHAARVGVAHL